MKSILDPALTFTSGVHTDIPKSFAHTRRARSSLRSRTGASNVALDPTRKRATGRRAFASAPRKPPVKAALDACRRCALWARATQGVPGEGSSRAHLMLVGEQPGDQEDQEGKPFVGPAGRLLRELLAEAGLASDDYYLTNAVKHFSWEPRGKRRIHKTPAQRDVVACAAWLDGEIAWLRPKVIASLGTTALIALSGKKSGIAASRSIPLRHSTGAHLVATYHPSALLRAPSSELRAELRRAVAEDLVRAVGLLRGD